MKPKRSSRLSTGTTSSYRSSKTPSLLNGSGDGKSILSDARDPEGSPAHRRSSSAQGSCSTSATTFEDADDAGGTGKSSVKLKEMKGNVIVSVRVRPDNSAGETPRNHGEWVVDGRQSLISHRGKDGGDYYYGSCAHDSPAAIGLWLTHRQIMSSLHMKITPRFTILLRKGWSGASWKVTTEPCLPTV